MEAQNLDQNTANAFADSWNNLPSGSVYDENQFIDWFNPITMNDVENKTVLELGCGNASLMVHVSRWLPSSLKGIDLGDSVSSAIKNMSALVYKNWSIEKGDLVNFTSSGFDLVYCIGVLHHLKDPKKGFDAVIANTVPGGRFHCWVYGKEGNNVVIYLIDPLRRLASKFPWWLTKYFIATPLAFIFFIYANIIKRFQNLNLIKKMPLGEYSLWIAKREFAFFRHVAFDQLVTPQTVYLNRETISNWLESCDDVDQNSIYIIMRNGNSWKFGGMLKKISS